MDKDKEIVITGIALNAKAGAVVSSDQKSYYIYDLSSWPDSVYNKNVEVKGLYVVVNHRQEDLKDEDGDWSQGMRKDQHIIKNATWKLIP